jgi:hypothetical protein
MKNILIGSRALAYWCPDFKLKDNADWDVISDEPIGGTEWHDPDLLNNHAFERYATKDKVNHNGQILYVMDMFGLAIIKRSHLWRDLSFQKHITMYHKYLVWATQLWTDTDRQLLKDRVLMTRITYPQGNPNLMQSKDAFFDDAVTKKYDHDHLHELVAYYDKPLYTRLLRDPALAWCEKSEWFKLHHEDKIKCIAEEAHVIAIERFMVPNSWKYPSKLAYIKAVDKVCTTLCSGWFRDYAIDHYPEVVQSFNQDKFNYVKKELP